MHSDALDKDLIVYHPPLGVNLTSLEAIKRSQAFFAKNPTKNGIQPIQMGGGSISDEELTPVRIGPLIGHTDDPTRMMA